MFEKNVPLKFGYGYVIVRLSSERDGDQPISELNTTSCNRFSRSLALQGRILDQNKSLSVNYQLICNFFKKFYIRDVFS